MNSGHMLRPAIALSCMLISVALLPIWIAVGHGIDVSNGNGHNQGYTEALVSPYTMKFSGAPDTSKGRILSRVHADEYPDFELNAQRVQDSDERSNHSRIIRELLDATNRFDGMLASIGMAADGKSIVVDLHERYKNSVEQSKLREYEQFAPFPVKWSFARIEPVPLLSVETE